MKKILAFILAAVLVTLMTGCNKPVEKTLTIANDSTYPLDRVVISPSEEIFDSDDAIYLLDAQANGVLMAANDAQDYTFEVPAELVDATWYLYVSAVDNGQLGWINTVERVGNIFSEITDVAEYQNEVYGFSFKYVSEIENFEVIPLTFKSLLAGDENNVETLAVSIPGTLSPDKPGTDAVVDTVDTASDEPDDTADTN